MAWLKNKGNSIKVWNDVKNRYETLTGVVLGSTGQVVRIATVENDYAWYPQGYTMKYLKIKEDKEMV